MTYKYLENIATADAAFEVEAPDLNSLFSESAQAMFGIMTDLSVIQPKSQKVIKLSADSSDRLLFDWLSELIYLKDKDKFLFSRFVVEIKKSKEYELNAEVYGEPIDLEKHQPRADVKAITYHMFKVEQRGEGWYARVVVDI